MSYIEFQISTSAFLGAQRNVLRSAKQLLCPPPPFTIGTTTLVFDRIEFGSNAIRHNDETNFAIFYTDHGQTIPTPNTATGFKTQIAQEVTVVICDLNDILSRPNQPPLRPLRVTGTLIFDLDFYALEEDCYTRVIFNHFEPGPLPAPAPLLVDMDELLRQVNQRLANAIPSPVLPAGLGKVSPGGTFLNAGVSVDGQLGRIAFRAQIGGSYANLDVPWTNFFHGLFEDRLQGKDWSFSVDAGLIQETLKTRVTAVLDGAHLPSDLHYYVNCTYRPTSGHARFFLNLTAYYVLLDETIEVEAEPQVPIDMSVGAPNALTVDIDFSQVLDFSSIYLRVADLLLTALGFPVESILLGLLGSAVIEGLADVGVDDCQQLSPTHVRCTFPVRLPPLPGTSRATLTDLLALNDAVALAGTMVVPDLTLASLELSVNAFERNIPAIDCSSAGTALIAAFHNDPGGFKVLHAKGFIENGGTAPLYLCDMSVLNDPLGAFPPANITADSQEAPITIAVDLPIPPAGYFAEPYPCDVLLVTTAGTRLMRFAPLAEVTSDALVSLEAQLVVRVGDCQVLRDPGPLHTGHDVHWSVDPATIVIVAHLWQLVAVGVAVGASISMIDPAGSEVVRAIARSAAPLRLWAFVPPGGERDMTIRLNADESAQDSSAAPHLEYSGREAWDEGPRIGVKQTLLYALGSIPLPGSCVRLLPARLEGTHGLMAILERGVVAYDFGNPGRPVPARSWQIDGVRGALEWQGGLLYFGDEGLGVIDRQGRQTPGPSDGEVVPIIDAVADLDALHALTSEGLTTYSRHLHKLSTTAVSGGRGVVRAGQKLAVGRYDGIEVYDTSDLRQPRREVFFEGLKGTTFLRRHETEAGSFLSVLEDGTAKSFRWNADVPEETASFNQAPWFVDSVRLGNLLIRIAKGGRSLELYRFGATHVV